MEIENGGSTWPATQNSRLGAHQPNSLPRLRPTKIEPNPRNESNPPNQSIGWSEAPRNLGKSRLKARTTTKTASDGTNDQRQPIPEARKPAVSAPATAPNVVATLSATFTRGSILPP